MRLKLQVILFTTILLYIGSSLFAQDNKHFSAIVDPSKQSVKAGEKFSIHLTLQFEKSWYIYSLKEQIGPEGIGPTQTEITIEPDALISIDGKIKAPKPDVKYDKGFEMDVESYKGAVYFELPVVAKKDMSFDKEKILVVLYLQQCTSKKCLPPMEFKIPAARKEKERISSGESDTENSQTESQQEGISSGESDIEDSQTESQQESITSGESDTEDSQTESQQEGAEKGSGGIFSFLWIAMAAGAGALLTPCVFPMVPITVSFFTKRAEQSRGKGLRDAFVYAIGIIITFTTLGLIFSIFFGATGIQEFAKNPWVYLFIAVIFIIFALNLFGAFEIQIPMGIMNKLDAKSRAGSGVTSVILMALTFSLASFSCTGPLVGAALISAASGEWFNPIISMLGFSTVLAAPFFLLALFPSALSAMPKAGGWMNNIKVILGFLVMATSLYFVSNAFLQWDIQILSREVFLSILIGISSLITLYILGIFRLSHDTPVEKVGTIRTLFAILFASFTFYLVSGLYGKPLGEIETFLPQSENYATISMGSSQSVNPEAAWFTDYNLALKEAKAQNKPIFLDFTGITCTNCKKMEKIMFPKASIKERLDRMIKVKLITDVRKEPYISNKKMQQKRFNSIEIPLYVILTPDEKVIAKTAYTNDEDEFSKFLEKGVE